MNKKLICLFNIKTITFKNLSFYYWISHFIHTKHKRTSCFNNCHFFSSFSFFLLLLPHTFLSNISSHLLRRLCEVCRRRRDVKAVLDFPDTNEQRVNLLSAFRVCEAKAAREVHRSTHRGTCLAEHSARTTHVELTQIHLAKKSSLKKVKNQ